MRTFLMLLVYLLLICAGVCPLFPLDTGKPENNGKESNVKASNIEASNGKTNNGKANNDKANNGKANNVEANNVEAGKVKGKQAIKYYRVDSIKTVSGIVQRIASEESYKKSKFIIIYLKEDKNKALYRVELAPQWFFDMDLMTGSFIRVTGSYLKAEGLHMIMARSLTSGGNIYHFRDKLGFPLWRGKKHSMKQMDKMKQRRRRRR
ncbi:MAG: hypothetical protein GY757_53365 [bacterium]|nr:hypothetical protein [bacterium]